jgi:hypothetical protein
MTAGGSDFLSSLSMLRVVLRCLFWQFERCVAISLTSEPEEIRLGGETPQVATS